MTTPRDDQPGAPREDPEITITKEVDPDVERAMEVIRTPDPDPFVDKWHPAVGHEKKDDKHQVKCEVCHRYLKTFALRVEHVKTFHPTVFYDCLFCPGAVFYTLRDLLSHCKKNHFVCNKCDSAHADQDTFRKHMATEHPEQPAKAGPEEGARKGFVCNRCGMYCSTAATFKIHVATHKRTTCPFCPQKFFDAASRNKHVSVKHSDRSEQSEQRKEKAEAEARQTKYFPCKMCVEGFNTKMAFLDLDKHITDKHVLNVCGECLKTFKTSEERDTHMTSTNGPQGGVTPS